MSEKDSKSVKVTAHMASQIAGDLPFLDAIIEFEMAQREGKAYKIQRHQKAPEYGEVHIPMLRKLIGNMLVPCCSSPIIVPGRESMEHFTKRLGVEHSALLSPEKRRIVATGNQVYKSYRLPLRTQLVDRIVWFCKGRRRPLKSLLRSVHSLGKKRSYGYGRVRSWELEWVDDDWSWFAASDQGPVLMRPLPMCDELPSGLLGARRAFAACQPPYWHPDRWCEVLVPM